MSGLDEQPTDAISRRADHGTTDEVPLRTWRTRVRAMLDGYHADTVSDAVLIVDELISNARRHAGGPADVRLNWLAGYQFLRVEVDDRLPKPPRIPPRPGRCGGRGLRLVQALAAAWGTRLFDSGKTVWAEIDLAR